MSERWLPIPGYEGRYEVSDIGNVRCLTRKGGGRRKVPYVMRVRINRHGYRAIALVNSSGASLHTFVHRLVLLAFVGNPPDGSPHGAHLNGVRDDNRLDNLAWVSVKENISHKRIHGTLPMGENAHNAKLTADKVKFCRDNFIRNHRVFGASALARRFGVSNAHMSRVISGKKWLSPSLDREQGSAA